MRFAGQSMQREMSVHDHGGLGEYPLEVGRGAHPADPLAGHGCTVERDAERARVLRPRDACVLWRVER